jgi:hypothetical protein
MSERWIGAIVALITIMIVLIMLALFETHSQSEGKINCMNEEDREKILRMSLRAIDQAFQHHVNNLFSNWVLDAVQQPTRAQKGMQNGIRAWLRAQEDAKNWAPPAC